MTLLSNIACIVWPKTKVNIACVRVTNVLGYQTQELLGKTAFDFYHPEDVADMKDNFERGTHYA